MRLAVKNLQRRHETGAITASALAFGLLSSDAMPHSRVEDFFAFQAAVTFSEEVHRLVRRSREAHNDFKYRGQLWEAADGVGATMAEGFARFNPSEMVNFLRYALASLAESQRWLRSGISRGYFKEADCKEVLTWAGRCKAATKAWLGSQLKEAERRKNARKTRRKRQ